MNDLYKILENLMGYANTQEAVEFIYVIKAWEKLSNEKKIDNELVFESFYNQKVDTKKLDSIFEKLSKTIKLFKIYRFDSKMFNDEDNLTYVLGLVKNAVQLPEVNEAFYNQKGMYDFSVSNQIAELGIKLLDGDSKELYVPFTNGFAYSYYTDKKIYADFQMPLAELVAELINILEDKNIEFNLTNALENPTFINPDAPHILKQFESVLSFPPFGMRDKLDTSKDKFHRFQFQRGTVLDIAHFEHILAQTKLKAVVLMPVGFTYRGSIEEEFRKYLIEQNYLEAIIQLAPNLHSATSIETTFFVINKQKMDDKVLFINLKDERFITRNGRKLVLKSLDDILDIYNNKKEIENISSIVANADIASSNYSFAIDRYVIPSNIKNLEKNFKLFEKVKLEEIADVRRSQLFKDEGEGEEVYEISPSDFSKSGFTLDCGKIKQIGSQYKRLQTYKLEPYDVLLSTKGTIGKVAIIGETNDVMIASQAIQVIRLHDKDKKEKAVALYMFLKSEISQTILSLFVSGSAMPQVATSIIKNLPIPLLSQDQQKKLEENFNKEVMLYKNIEELNNKIKSIHTNFLGDK